MQSRYIHSILSSEEDNTKFYLGHVADISFDESTGGLSVVFSNWYYINQFGANATQVGNESEEHYQNKTLEDYFIFTRKLIKKGFILC